MSSAEEMEMITADTKGGQAVTEGRSFRDSLTTVDDDGKRIWVYAKKPKGKWYRRRGMVGYSLLALLFSIPFIRTGGHPFMLFNFVDRQFILFGQVFWPQDFYLFVIGFISFIIFIVLFTAIFGRLWCGWACPHTIFLEMIYRKVEYLIEGDSVAQRKLAKEGFTMNKMLRKGAKHAVFFGIAFIIANTFLSYIIGTDPLFRIMTEPPSHHLGGLIGITVFSGVFYYVFAYFREQACTIVCPYGRIQSVMLDNNSLTVAYDHKRGEPRGKWGRKRETTGDCIDCRQCVEVCPTGIDIRNGIQLECVNCTACIDACNLVMAKIGKPENLIRFASQEGVEKGEKFTFTPRRIGYSVALVMLIGLLTTLIVLRSDVQANILRTPGMTYVEDLKTGLVKNIYNVKVLNKTFKDMPVEFRLVEGPGKITTIGRELVAPGDGYGEGIVSVEINRSELHSPNLPLKIEVFANGRKMQTVKTNFMGPLDVN